MLVIQSKIHVNSITQRPYKLDNGKEGVSYSVVTFDDNGFPESYKITDDLASKLQIGNDYILGGLVGYYQGKLNCKFSSIVK